jgi:homoaconitate hydratase
MSQNLIEKIAQSFAVGLDENSQVHSGDFISIQPAHVMTHDNSGAVIPKFRSIGAKKVANPKQIVFALDHNVQDTSEQNLAKYQRIGDFASEMGIVFYPAGRGIGHQIMCEEGYAWPGSLVVASDSHSNMYGGLGCLGTPVVRTDAAAIWATGRTWWQIPPVARVCFTGKLAPEVSGKDVILSLCSLLNEDQVLNHAIEFCGSGLTSLDIEQRLSIANMTTEWGALAGVFPIDTICLEWLEQRLKMIEDADHPRINRPRIEKLKNSIPSSDSDAGYSVEIELDLSTVTAWVAGPNAIKSAQSAVKLEAEKIKINKAYLVSCVNSRLGDLAAAANIVRGQKINPDVEFYVSAASSIVQTMSEKRGDWQALLEAGAISLPPGCGPCIGLGRGLLGSAEVGISATNRNFKGRMGAPDSTAYLASPAVVAQSAINGYISAPGNSVDTPENATVSFRKSAVSRSAGADVQILPGFPQTVEGELLYVSQDNLNTDGIYPGAYTYKDDMGPADQAAVVMENYDTDFRQIARSGDILLGGYNFGTGSSREQAATALKHFGIQMVLAGSLSETYKRNALNNGFLVLEVPELLEDIRTQQSTEKLSVRTGINIAIDFKSSILKTADNEYHIPAVGIAAQELIICGGLEAWVKERL